MNGGLGISKILFIPSTGVGTIYLCPHAISLDEVSPLCENVEVINVGETLNGKRVTPIEYDGQEYYLVFCVESTGGGEYGNIEELIKDLNDYIQGLSDESFKNNSQQRKNALANKIKEVFIKIENKEYQEAINKLENDIRAKAGGNETTDDWIIDSDNQIEIYKMIDDLIVYLRDLSQASF